MKGSQNNVAYIDGANLYNGTQSLGWKLDYARFRVWLKEKYGVKQAYLFIGLIAKNKDLYTKLQLQGYTLVFKDVLVDKYGKAKGNCDSDIVVKAMEECYENTYDKALLVASDGDYASLVRFLQSKQKFEGIISPAREDKCSVLLKRTDAPIMYISDKKSTLEYRK